jgi:uncharacterized damage-inducible protein DinB
VHGVTFTPMTKAFTSAVQTILSRDLRGMQAELRAYADEEQIWEVRPGLTNAAGTLALHAAGNLRHFVGAVLGGSGYVRDRDAEFSRRDASRAEIERELDAAVRTVESVVPSLTDEQLERPFPIPLAGREVRTSDFLAHLVAHLAYHLGQVDYHRRLVTGGPAIGVVSPAELPAARD